MEDIIREILDINPKYDADFLEKAYLKAEELHRGQKRKSGEPYIIHPKAVALILADLGMDDETVAAGLLHDVIEDTGYTYDQCVADFGESVAQLVDGVTKLTSLVYSSEEDKQAENIRKMFLAMSHDIRVIVIKLADRVHNLRTIDYQTPAKIHEKCKESLEIYAPLAARLGIYTFKFEIEDICFQHLWPDAYAELDRQMRARRKENKLVIDDIIAEIKTLLAGLGINYDIYGRSKHYYSIYKKMKQQNKTLDEIFDINAVRVIVETVRDCYAVLGAVHTRWTPIPGRFKDYIAMPKPNNYQSLHTTVIGESGVPFEIQIRTREMHRIAEFGIAAHWKYKEGIGDKRTDEEVKIAWLRQALEWQQDVKDDPKEFMQTLKMDLFTNQVFVFTPMGKVMELPAGSTPLDFAFKIHTNVGLKCVGAKVNGKMVPLDYILQNGEIVEAVTNQNSKGPSADWLKIVQTNSAKTKIRQFLKKENRPENADRGRDMVEKAAKRKGIDTQLFLKTPFLLKAAKEQDFSTIDDLYNAISYGGPLLNKTINLCIGYYNAEKAEEQERKEKEEEKKRSKKRVEHTGGVRIGGFNSVLIHYAKCCNPVPGDDIIGFTTKGNGVSIHRRDCINILSLPEADRGRLIDAEWEISEKSMRFDAGISIVSEDRKGLLSEISKICESMDADINGLTAKTDRVGSISINLTVSISSATDVEKLIARFRQTPGVTEVFRSNF